MDVRFLGEVSDAFIVKHSLYNKCTKDELQQDLYSLIKELRETDIELYDHLYDTNRIQQVKILETYLDYQYRMNGDGQVIEEIGPISLAIGGISALVTILYQNRINKAIFATAKSIGEVVSGIGEFLTKHGRYWKFRYAIVQQNAKKCYLTCDIDEKTLSAWTYFSVGKEPPILASQETFRQGECLKKCYVRFSIESIALLAKSYFACLKRSGGWQEVMDARPDDILTVVSGLQLSSLCQAYYEEMKKSMDMFSDLLDFVFGTSSPAKQGALKDLKNKVIESRKEINKANNLNQFK